MADYDVPAECRYTEEDEWVRPDGDRFAVGVTDYAQQQLGDVVFVELPAAGDTVKRGESFGVIESVKAVSDLYSPVDGTVAQVNEALTDAPEKVNESCYGDGWLIVVEGVDPASVDSLMDADGYRAYIASRD